MNNKIPRKYLIIGVILILPEEIVWLGSLLTPYNLIGHPLFVVSPFLFSFDATYIPYISTHMNAHIENNIPFSNNGFISKWREYIKQ